MGELGVADRDGSPQRAGADQHWVFSIVDADGPQLSELLTYRIDAITVRKIQQLAAAHARGVARGAVGVIGVSFAGGLALMAAAEQASATPIGFVVTVGAHHDLQRLCRYYAGEPLHGPDGEHLRRYAPAVLAYRQVPQPPNSVAAPRTSKMRSRAGSNAPSATGFGSARWRATGSSVARPYSGFTLHAATLATIKPGTVRKLLRQHGLDRIAVRDGAGAKTRLRWQAAAPDALWHGDVCHGPTLQFGGVRTPLRIHGLLDDCSRYVVALEAHASEREEDMLHVLTRALRLHGRSDVLFLDNGSTYRGEVLRIACSRLGISPVHARPYDPEARGKMERFWRTCREGCLDHLGDVGSLADVNQRLAVFLERYYHPAPHAGLLGRSPLSAYAPSERAPNFVDEAQLREALAVRERRRVRRDTTVSVLGRIYELQHGFLAGRVVDIVYSHVDDPPQPEVEYEGKRYPLALVDPVANSRRMRPRRNPKADPPRQPVAFDPSCTTRAAADPDIIEDMEPCDEND